MEHSHFVFSLTDFDTSDQITASYDAVFVTVSLVIAVSASLISFSLSARTARADFKNERVFWAVASSCFLGLGIWAMHFVGMLAYRLPLEVTYDPVVTVISIVPAILGSYFVVAYHPQKQQRLWLYSVFMGLAIASMHFIGMAAMKMQAAMTYNGGLFLVSIFFAIVLSNIALRIHLRVLNKNIDIVKQLIPAIVMGCAISGMHYTGMISMHVFPISTTVFSDSQHHKDLGYLVVFMVAFFTVLFVLLLELRARTLSSDRFTAVLNTVQEGVLTFDNDGRLEFVNPAALAMFGYTKSAIRNKRISELVSHTKDGLASLLNEVIKAANCPEPRSTPIRLKGLKRNGDMFTLSLLVNKLPGKHKAFVCTVKDLSDVKNQEVFTQTVFDTLPNMLFVKDANDLSFTHVNDMGSKALGIDKTTLVGLTDFDVFKRDDAEKIIESDLSLLEKDDKESCEEHSFSLKGEERYLKTKKVVIFDASEKPRFIVSLSEDVTELRSTQQKLESLNKRMSMAADAAHIGFWEWNLDTNELIWDDWMHRIYSIPKDEFDDNYSVWAKTVHLDDYEAVKAKIDHAISSNTEFHAQFRIQLSRDVVRHIRADGRIEGNKMCGINVDVTEQVEAEIRVTELANQDTLTGLANRHALSSFVRHEFLRLERTLKKCFCLYLDLNQFKPVNDAYGHGVGDEVLIEVAKRLRKLCRVSDLAARVGGDEFVIVVTDVDAFFSLRELIARTHSAINQPAYTSIGFVSISASIGYASYPDEASSLDELIRIADKRMFDVKGVVGEKAK